MEFGDKTVPAWAARLHRPQRVQLPNRKSVCLKTLVTFSTPLSSRGAQRQTWGLFRSAVAWLHAAGCSQSSRIQHGKKGQPWVLPSILSNHTADEDWRKSTCVWFAACVCWVSLSLRAFDVVFKDDPFMLSKKTIHIVGMCEFSWCYKVAAKIE